VHAYNSRTPQAEAGSQELEVSLSYIPSSRSVRAIKFLKKKKNNQVRAFQTYTEKREDSKLNIYQVRK
jgi:hypothetical protein